MKKTLAIAVVLCTSMLLFAGENEMDLDVDSVLESIWTDIASHDDTPYSSSIYIPPQGEQYDVGNLRWGMNVKEVHERTGGDIRHLSTGSQHIVVTSVVNGIEVDANYGFTLFSGLLGAATFSCSNFSGTRRNFRVIDGFAFFANIVTRSIGNPTSKKIEDLDIDSTIKDLLKRHTETFLLWETPRSIIKAENNGPYSSVHFWAKDYFNLAITVTN